MLWRFMEIGGFMMWPLLGCSVLLTAVLFERSWTVLFKHRLLGKPLPGAAKQSHRRALMFFTDVPPSLGLLGTVIGVVQSFQLVEGQLDGEAVGAGLGVACLTTVFGLAIGIVAAIASYILDWAAPAETAEAS